MLNFKFELNNMQEEAIRNRGENIVFDAPTGSGKTEAILLSIAKGKKVAYWLPTVTSCHFMYRRLVKDFGEQLSIGIKTSLLTEKNIVSNGEYILEIMCPDSPLIDYLETNKFEYDTVVLDELDNYPSMVKTAVLELIKNRKDIQFIVASATIDKDLSSKLGKFNFERINYNTELRLIKYKYNTCRYRDILGIIRANKGKKIGIIMNSISDMKRLERYIEFKYDVDYMYHTSGGLDYCRVENENRLFLGDFTVVLSNDLISYSVDINFDILITQMTDRMGLFIQRLGRCNRNNESVFNTNLYIIDDFVNELMLPFIDDWEKKNNLNKFNRKPIKVLTYNEIRSLKSSLEGETLPTLNNIKDYWKERKDLGFEKDLRKAPLTFKVDAIFDKVTYKDGKVYDEEIETKASLKWNRSLEEAYSRFPFEDKECKKKTVVFIKGNQYRITGKEREYYEAEDCYISYGYCPFCGEKISNQDYDRYYKECVHCR